MDQPRNFQHETNGYRRCLAKVVHKTGELLCDGGTTYDHDKAHQVKSLLYAAIEQAGMETDRLVSVQELLRELLTLVALQADPVRQERKEALTVLERLKKHHAGVFQI